MNDGLYAVHVSMHFVMYAVYLMHLVEIGEYLVFIIKTVSVNIHLT